MSDDDRCPLCRCRCVYGDEDCLCDIDECMGCDKMECRRSRPDGTRRDHGFTPTAMSLMRDVLFDALAAGPIEAILLDEDGEPLPVKPRIRPRFARRGTTECLSTTEHRIDRWPHDRPARYVDYRRTGDPTPITRAPLNTGRVRLARGDTLTFRVGGLGLKLGG